jgi:hypothetical protein
MVDTLHVVIPRTAAFTPEFSRLYQDVGSDPKYFHPVDHYERGGDLRPLGYDVRLSLFSTNPKSDGNHKLEIMRAGDHSLKQNIAEIERIFYINPFKMPRSMKLRIPGDQAGQYEDVASLPVRRADLAADVPEHDVLWFKDRMRVQFKQFGAKIGKMDLAKVGEAEGGKYVVEYAEMGMKGIQTLYFGKRPNCIRVYDKTAERFNDYRKVVRRASPDAELPTFEQSYGFAPDTVLTRVERMMGASVPRAINTLDRLQKNAADFNPFERIRLSTDGKPLPSLYDYDKITYLAGLKAREWIESNGYDWFFKWCNQDGNRNGHRVLARLRDFIPMDEGDEMISAVELYERYRQSVSRQLAA